MTLQCNHFLFHTILIYIYVKEVKNELELFQNKYVITLADKISRIFVIMCAKGYHTEELKYLDDNGLITVFQDLLDSVRNHIFNEDNFVFQK